MRRSSPVRGPFDRGGHLVWEDRAGAVEVRFAGRGPGGERGDVLERIGEARPVAWAKQIHSATVLPAGVAGECGEGDALWSREPGLALSVVTADCVPVLLAGPGGHLAAVHAGWRGIAGRVLPATLEVLRERAGGAGGGGWTAWIGPAIGPCCYEVGEDVAGQVVAAAGDEALHPRPGSRPHLDLQAAARHQLQAAGVDDVRTVAVCTRCATDRLASYRREGRAAGRNVAFVWRSD